MPGAAGLWPQGNVCSSHEHVAVPSAPAQRHGIRICRQVEGALVCGNLTHGNAIRGVQDEGCAGSAVYGNLEREAAAPSSGNQQQQQRRQRRRVVGLA